MGSHGSMNADNGSATPFMILGGSRLVPLVCHPPAPPPPPPTNNNNNNNKKCSASFVLVVVGVKLRITHFHHAGSLA